MFASNTQFKKKPPFSREPVIADAGTYISEESNSKLFSIMQTGNYNEIKSALTSYKYNIKTINENNDTIVHILLNGDNSNINSENILNLLRLLKSFNIYLNNKNKAGLRPIHLACKLSDYRISHFLLEDSMDLNIFDTFGKTPFHYAIEGVIITADEEVDNPLEPDTIKIPKNIGKIGDDLQNEFELKREYVKNFLKNHKYKLDNALYKLEDDNINQIATILIEGLSAFSNPSDMDEMKRKNGIMARLATLHAMSHNDANTDVKQHDLKMILKILYEIDVFDSYNNIDTNITINKSNIFNDFDIINIIGKPFNIYIEDILENVDNNKYFQYCKYFNALFFYLTNPSEPKLFSIGYDCWNFENNNLFITSNNNDNNLINNPRTSPIVSSHYLRVQNFKLLKCGATVANILCEYENLKPMINEIIKEIKDRYGESTNETLLYEIFIDVMKKDDGYFNKFSEDIKENIEKMYTFLYDLFMSYLEDFIESSDEFFNLFYKKDTDKNIKQIFEDLNQKWHLFLNSKCDADYIHDNFYLKEEHIKKELENSLYYKKAKNNEERENFIEYQTKIELENQFDETKRIFYKQLLLIFFDLDEEAEKEEEEMKKRFSKKKENKKDENKAQVGGGDKSDKSDKNPTCDELDEENKKSFAFYFMIIYKIISGIIYEEKIPLKDSIQKIFMASLILKYDDNFERVLFNNTNDDKYIQLTIKYNLLKNKNNNDSISNLHKFITNTNLADIEYNTKYIAVNYNEQTLNYHDDSHELRLIKIDTNYYKIYPYYQELSNYIIDNFNNLPQHPLQPHIHICSKFIQEYDGKLIQPEDSEELSTNLFQFKTKDQILQKLEDKNLYHYEYIPHVDIQSEVELPNTYKFIQINKKLIDMFLNKNININIPDRFGKTPLHYALAYLGSDIIKRLIYHRNSLIFNNANTSQSPFEFFIDLFSNYCKVLDNPQNKINTDPIYDHELDRDLANEDEYLIDRKKDNAAKYDLDKLKPNFRIEYNKDNECHYRTLWMQILYSMKKKDKKKTLQIYEHIFEEFIRNINRQILYSYWTIFAKSNLDKDYISNLDKEFKKCKSECFHIKMTGIINNLLGGNGTFIKNQDSEKIKTFKIIKEFYDKLIEDSEFDEEQMSSIEKFIGADNNAKVKKFVKFIFHIISNDQNLLIKFLTKKMNTDMYIENIINKIIFGTNEKVDNYDKFIKYDKFPKILLIKLYKYYKQYDQYIGTLIKYKGMNTRNQKTYYENSLKKIMIILRRKILLLFEKYMHNKKHDNKSDRYELIGVVSKLKKNRDTIQIYLQSIFPGIDLSDNKISKFIVDNLIFIPDKKITFDNGKITFNDTISNKILPILNKSIVKAKNHNQKMNFTKKSITNPNSSKTIFPYLYVERERSVYSLNKFYDLMVFSKENSIQHSILDRIINTTITSIIYNYIIKHDLPEFLIRYVYSQRKDNYAEIINKRYEIINALEQGEVQTHTHPPHLPIQLNIKQTLFEYGYQCVHLFFYKNLSIEDSENTKNPLFKLDVYEKSVKDSIKEILKHVCNIDLTSELDLSNRVDEELLNKYKEIFYIFLSNARKLFIHYIDFIKNQKKFLDILDIFIKKIKHLNSRRT